MPCSIWTPLAESDLEEILGYIAVDEGRPLVADQIGRQFQEQCDRLAANPMLGESRPELGERLRLSSFKRWAIVFRPNDDGIEVVGVVDAARDYGHYFRNR